MFGVDRGLTGSVAVSASQKTKALALDRAVIEKKALDYLDKFDVTSARLRTVLTDFVERRAKALDVDAAAYLEVVGELLERYQNNGLIDDRRFAATMARSLVARGVSRQTIRRKLMSRGVVTATIDETIDGLNTEASSELMAARALVRKRKLGLYRTESARRESARKDLGVLARAGFDFETAKTALGLEGAEDEESF